MLLYSAFSSWQALSLNAYLWFWIWTGVLMLLNQHKYSIFAICSGEHRRNKQHDSQFSFLINGLVCFSSCDTGGEKRTRLRNRMEGSWQDMVFVWSLKGERFHYLRDSGGCFGGGVFFPRCLSQLWCCYIHFCVFSHSGISVAPAGVRQPKNQLWWMAQSVQEDGGVTRVQSSDGDTSLLGPHDFFN